MPEIDDEKYADGRRAFASGMSIRSVVELGAALDEDKALSLAMGFADAVLDKLRVISAP